jgi:hypothetical protein
MGVKEGSATVAARRPPLAPGHRPHLHRGQESHTRDVFNDHDDRRPEPYRTGRLARFGRGLHSDADLGTTAQRRSRRESGCRAGGRQRHVAGSQAMSLTRSHEGYPVNQSPSHCQRDKGRGMLVENLPNRSGDIEATSGDRDGSAAPIATGLPGQLARSTGASS